MEQTPTTISLNRVTSLGNYLPRQCGIAILTTDLCESIAAEYADTACIALPVNDAQDGYAYPPRVWFELVEKDLSSYRYSADFLNIYMEELSNDEAQELASRYLAFLWYAFNPEIKRFRNFMDYQHRWLEGTGSDDSHGRSLWALGFVLSRTNTPAFQNMASRLFEQALPPILDITSPRTWAFTLLGIHEYLRRFGVDCMAGQVGKELAERLLQLYQQNCTADWRSFEDRLTYCNAVLPYALLLFGHWIPSQAMTEAGLEALRWLVDQQRADTGSGHFVPVGSNSPFLRGRRRSRFDQQPVEAQSMVLACLEAYRITADPRWRKEAGRAFEWFLGCNDLNLPLYDPTTGGCCNGLHPDRANENQRAESTLAFLQALSEMWLVENSLQFMEVQAP